MRLRLARLEDAPRIARAHVSVREATYRGLLPEEAFTTFNYDYLLALWEWDLNPESGLFTYLAESGAGDILGFSQAGPDSSGLLPGGAEMHLLYLLPEHQGGILGRFLASAVASRLRELGFTKLLLWTMADNLPAGEFFQALGGQVRFQRPHVLAPERLVLGYAWDDLSSLILPARLRGPR
jgi:GNAT superfamily N-acetyltransferase